jgi:hypothetical protein
MSRSYSSSPPWYLHGGSRIALKSVNICSEMNTKNIEEEISKRITLSSKYYVVMLRLLWNKEIPKTM